MEDPFATENNKDKEITNEVTLAKNAINHETVLRPITTQSGASNKGTKT